MKIGFKLFTKELTASRGRGNFEFEVGKTYEEQDARCASCGFHFAENPLDCLSYYPFKGSRKCVVGGEDYEEDGHGSRIAAKKIKILRELTDEEFVACCLEYIITHPRLKIDLPIREEGLYISDEEIPSQTEGTVIGLLNRETGEIDVYIA